MTYTTPAGTVNLFCENMLERPHLLIAGSTGSGKSVMINNLLSTVLYSPPGDQAGGKLLILVDPKRVELAAFRYLPHTLAHAAGHNPEAWAGALNMAVSIMDSRYNYMEAQRIKDYPGGDLYVIIDEWASIIKSDLRGKPCRNAVLRLTSEGRAAKVHVILATQVPKADIIPTEIRENFTARLALMTQTAGESRLLMGVKGCEDLLDPKTAGEALGYYCLPGKDNRTLYRLPYIRQGEIDRLIAWWEAQAKPAPVFKPKKKSLFARVMGR